MSSLTINIDQTLKQSIQRKAKQDGITLTFILTQALKAYNEDKLRFGLINSDGGITASFDVSTQKGVDDCIESFESSHS